MVTITVVAQIQGEGMITLSKSALKPKMLEYLRRVEETGEGIIVTSHRKPVLRIERIETREPVDVLFKDVIGKVKVGPEVMEPETDEWDEV